MLWLMNSVISIHIKLKTSFIVQKMTPTVTLRSPCLCLVQEVGGAGKEGQGEEAV